MLSAKHMTAGATAPLPKTKPEPVQKRYWGSKVADVFKVLGGLGLAVGLLAAVSGELTLGAILIGSGLINFAIAHGLEYLADIAHYAKLSSELLQKVADR